VQFGGLSPKEQLQLQSLLLIVPLLVREKLLGADSAGTAFWGFWGAVGFLAGFNERWAYGLVGRGATSRKGGG